MQCVLTCNNLLHENKKSAMCLRTFDLVTLLITTLLHKCWMTPFNTIPLSSESFNIMQQGT